MEHPAIRLAAFLKAQNLSQTEAAALLGCHHTMVSLVMRRAREPGRRLANTIERVTAAWAEGPILSVHWDAVEDDEPLDPTG